MAYPRIHPNKRCVYCNAILPGTTGRNARVHCLAASCRNQAITNPVCTLCKEPLYRDFPAQKMHPQCKVLHICPAPKCSEIVTARSGSNLNQNKYHSLKCLKEAWRGQPLPDCGLCGKPLELPTKPPWQDPEQFHRKCVSAMRSGAAETKRLEKKVKSKTPAMQLPKNMTGSNPAQIRRNRLKEIHDQQHVGLSGTRDKHCEFCQEDKRKDPFAL